ncbi:hypothetical protein HYX19_03465 [Candidatus Woesearchaeota archaeon]|nr:hypothetical protein [Candidatus Woesearchaeota archaeon]
MSVYYKLFGIPKTLDDFIDDSKRTNQKEITIVLNQKTLPTFTYVVGFQTSTRELKLKTFEFFPPIRPYTEKSREEKLYNDAGFALFRKKVFLYYSEAIEKIEKAGLKVKLHGASGSLAPLDRVKEDISLCDRQFEEIKQEYLTIGGKRGFFSSTNISLGG